MSDLGRERLHGQHGFSLTELLVALLIAGLVFAGVYQIYINSTRTNTVQDQVAEMQQTARVVMDQLMRELRLAGYDPKRPTGQPGLWRLDANPSELNPSSGSPQELFIQGDFDGDNKVDQVTYTIDTTTDPSHPTLLRKEGANDPVKFAYNVENLKATFFDGDNCPLGTAPCSVLDIAAVKRATLRLTVRTDRPDINFIDPANAGDPNKKHYRRRTLEADVVLRNRLGGGDTKPPQCPTNVRAVTTGDCRIIRVTWDRPLDPDNDLAGYYIYYDQAPINTSTSSFVNISDKGPPPQPPNYDHDLSVPSGGTGIWNIAVTSYDSSGNQCDSNTSNGTPPNDPVVAIGSPVNINAAGNKEPAAPGNATAMPGSNMVTIDWGQVLTNAAPPISDGSLANDLLGYRLYRSTSPDMSGAVRIADEFALSISQIVGGQTTHTTQYVDSAANTPVPGGPVNCTAYYYQVSVVDKCDLESARSTVQSEKPDGGFSPGVTPPDNDKKPPAPTITSLYAGDDTSSIIVSWSLPAPSPSESAPVELKIYWRNVDAGEAWYPDPSNPNPPITIPIVTTPTSGTQIINGLVREKEYQVKVSAFDDSATACGNESSDISEIISTAACAPKNNAHKLVPGISSAGISVPEDGSAVIGLLSPSADRYVTWVVDPHDCTPDSSTFGRQGFDYKNPPDYTEVAAYPGTPPTSAHVEFFIDDPAVVTDNPNADVAYGTAATGNNLGNPYYPTNSLNLDYAPRGSDGYYHFPTDPLDPMHLDTAQFCDVRYNFEVVSVDGEQYKATSAIPVEVKNGGITVDSSITVTSDISTPDDFHHIVRFGIKNSHAGLDLKLNKITLKWNNNNAYLEKLEVLDSNKNPIGLWDSATGTPSGRQGIGAELTLNPVPVLNKAGASGDKGYLRLTFKDVTGAVTSNVDMRAQNEVADEEITITQLEQQDAAAVGPSDGLCSGTTAGSVTVHRNPTIVRSNTVQDQPSANTIPSTSAGAIIVPAGSVTVSAEVTEQTGFPLSPGSVKAYYRVDSIFSGSAPLRPSAPGGGGNYPNTATGTPNIVTGKWDMVIPSPSAGQQIWYYIEAMDDPSPYSPSPYPFNRNFDSLPDTGAFTFGVEKAFSADFSHQWVCTFPDAVILNGTVKDENSSPVDGATVKIDITGPVAPDGISGTISGTVATDSLGNFTYQPPQSPYVFMGDSTIDVMLSRTGFVTKSCSMPRSWACTIETFTCN